MSTERQSAAGAGGFQLLDVSLRRHPGRQRRPRGVHKCVPGDPDLVRHSEPAAAAALTAPSAISTAA